LYQGLERKCFGGAGVIADETLARRIQNGDRLAVDPLVERHYSPLIGYLYRMTGGDRALAEDLAHETFMRAIASIAQYQHPRPFKAWLYAIATNAARNHYKSADQRLTTSAGDEFPEIADDQPIDAVLIEGEEAAAVIQALDSLPDHQREVVLLYYYQQFSMQEIAETLQIPVGTVKSRLSIGISRLRERMKAIDYGR